MLKKTHIMIEIISRPTNVLLLIHKLNIPNGINAERKERKAKMNEQKDHVQHFGAAHVRNFYFVIYDRQYVSINVWFAI